MTLDYDNCFAAAAAFSNKRDLRAQSNSAFQWLKRNGMLESACAHMKPLYRSLSDDDIATIAEKYTHRRGFKVGDQAAYKSALKRGILDRVCAHMAPVRRTLTNEQIFEISGQYGSRSEFVRKDSGAYQTATARGILDEVCAHMDGKGARRLTDEELLQIAGAFETRNDLKLGDFGAYVTIIRRGLIGAACFHMAYGATGFREDKPASLYQFRITTPDGLVLYKVGITNRMPRQRLTTMRIHRGVKAVLTGTIAFELGRDARIAEKRLHGEFAASRYDGPPVMRNGQTELFTVDILTNQPHRSQ